MTTLAVALTMLVLGTLCGFAAAVVTIGHVRNRKIRRMVNKFTPEDCEIIARWAWADPSRGYEQPRA